MSSKPKVRITRAHKFPDSYDVRVNDVYVVHGFQGDAVEVRSVMGFKFVVGPDDFEWVKESDDE